MVPPRELSTDPAVRRTSRSGLLRTMLFTLLIALCGGQATTPALSASPGIDWYNPPPQEYSGVAAEILMPTELISGVYPDRIEEATAILGRAIIMEITRGQATYLASVGDPAVVIAKQLEDAKTKMQVFIERHRRGHQDKPKEVREQLDDSDQQVIEKLKREIAGYEQWKADVKPYLIKAVSLGGGSGPFFGALVGDKLFVSHVAVGRGLVEMKRMPVVAYLPKKPQHIYHVLSGMQ